MSENATSEVDWYSCTIEQCLEKLESSRQGLGADEVSKRQAQYGANELKFSKTPAWLRLLQQFNDPMVIILLITAVTTAILTLLGQDMLPDTVVILGVVVLNAILGFVQEGKAEGALEALRDMMVQQCLVLRDSIEQKVPAKTLVPGDIVILQGGDKLPADVRFIETNNTHVDESALTGESIPVLKISEAVTGTSLVPGDQHNMGFSGTFLTRGTSLGLVVATGTNTLFGQIADMVSEAGKTLTPLQKKMKEFVRSLIIAILIVGAFDFILGVFLGYDIGYSFLGAISLVVAAIPEMLPALVTSILAFTGIIMARRKALIRKLPAAETLGATSVICSDKTGTLTENHMTVTRIYSGGREFSVSGAGYETEGGFSINREAVNPGEYPALMKLLFSGFYCNNARLSASGAHTGDPTEIALQVSGRKGNMTTGKVQRLAEIPFDSATKYMAVLVEIGGQRLILVKGAPEVVYDMCTREMDSSGNPVPINCDAALSEAARFGADALRTLAFAMSEVPLSQSGIDVENLNDMCFVGLQGMIDPPRQSAIEAVAQCKQAGIRTVMITGDHPDTARAIALQLGIEADAVCTGAELSAISDEQLDEVVEKVSVYARVAPEHKKRIAEALQRNGHVVAMTGDGVNDAPALKTADIGIAMGSGGTEVAKEASDMVLIDDNFATIVAAVEEGRHAWNNLRKAILYTLPTNAAQAFLIIGAVLMASFVPVFSIRFVLEPVQILWINLLDSVLLTMPLMMEPKEQGLLKKRPRNPSAHIIDGLFLRRVIVLGLAISLPGFLVYYHFGSAAVQGEAVDEYLLTQAQTAAFWGILIAHFGYVISARSVHKSVFSFNPLGNPWLIGGICLSILVRMIPTWVPDAAVLFRTAAFPLEWWPLILACFFPSFLMIEAEKVYSRRSGKRAIR